MQNYVLRFLMELNSKIQIEQPAPPGVHRQRSEKRDEQTNKQETNEKLYVFGRPGGGWNPNPTKLVMAIENLEHVLAPRKLFGVRRTVSPLRGAENLAETDTVNLKPP